MAGVTGDVRVHKMTVLQVRIHRANPWLVQVTLPNANVPMTCCVQLNPRTKKINMFVFRVRRAKGHVDAEGGEVFFAFRTALQYLFCEHPWLVDDPVKTDKLYECFRGSFNRAVFRAARRRALRSIEMMRRFKTVAQRRARAGRVIARAVEWAFCDPGTALCRARLLREFNGLVEETEQHLGKRPGYS